MNIQALSLIPRGKNELAGSARTCSKSAPMSRGARVGGA
jgi:hypothetical protein